MADRKITDLTALAAGSQATGDFLTIVDVSEAAAVDKNKKITVESLFKGIPSNVGIGTSSPSNNLDVLSTTPGATVNARVGSTATSGASNANLIINNGGTGNGTLRFDYESNSNRASIGVTASTQDLFFTTAGSERLRIDSSGNVGIGTSAPNFPLTVVANSGASTIGVRGRSSDNISQLDIYSNNGATLYGRIQSSSGSVLLGSTSELKFGTGSSVTERLRIDSSGNVGINNSSPSSYNSDGRNLVVGSGSGSQGLTIASGTSGYGNIYFADGTSGDALYSGMLSYYHADNHMQFRTASTERMRIDSSGKLLVGTSTSNGSAGSKLEVAKQTMTTSDMGLASFQLVSSSSRWPQVFIEKSRGSAVGDKNLVSNGDSLGELAFRGSDGTNYLTGASIIATVNGTTGTNDLPTDLRFSTTADGASSPTERMRIDSSGTVIVKAASANKGIELEANGSRVARFAVLNPGVDHTPSIGTLLGNDFYFITNNTERMRIGISGNVGIGTSSPASFLSVGGNATTTAKPTVSVVPSSGNASISLRGGSPTISFDVTSGGDGTIIYDSSSDLLFKNGTLDSSSEKMRITSSGRVSIGTTSGTAKLSIWENASVNEPVRINDTNNTNSLTHRISFRTGDVEVGKIISNRSSTQLVSGSDYRLKENVVNIADGISRVKQLLPKRFNFIVNADETVDGFIAHEAQAVVPEAVTGTYNEVDNDGNAVMQCMDQSKLVPLLTAALQEAIAKIETLETKVAALEAG